MISTVLEGGWIVDGSGRPRFATDLAIDRDRIVRIGDCAELDAVVRIDVRGAIVAPGFIDAGSPGPAKLAQGITTDLRAIGNLELLAREDAPHFIAVDDIASASHDARLHVTNLRVEWPSGRADMHRLLERIDRANDRGADITCDVTPYVATWIDLPSLLPANVNRAALDDDAVAAVTALEMQARFDRRLHDIVLAEVGSEERARWCGMRIDDIGAQMRLSPARAAVELIRDEGESALAFAFCLNEDDIATAFSASFCMPGSHPRVVGAFPRVFGRYVRGRGVFSLEEAVARSSALPARTFGLRERGTIAPGSYADLVVFDEATFRDAATYETPDALPVGVRHIFVNGESV